MDHRLFPRYPYEHSALLITKNKEVKVDIKNISENGILMYSKCPQNLKRWDSVRLFFHDNETDNFCPVEASVARARVLEDNIEEIAITYHHNESISRMITMRNLSGVNGK